MKRSVNEYDENRGGGTGKALLKDLAGGTGIAAGLYGIGKADREMTKLGDERREKEQREANAEMKRESRGVEKPANFDAIEEAKQEARDRKAAKLQEKAYNESLTSENKAKGGRVKKMASGGMTASKRADGIASRGKTKCKMY